MTTLTNRQFKLIARPVGLPKRSDFEFTSVPVAEPGAGEVLVKVQYISLDPAMRGWMNEGKSYIPPVKLGEVMRAGAAGRVIASKNAAFAAGDYVTGWTGVQEYSLSDGNGLTKVDPRLAPLPVYLGTLGMPGMTAYFGLLDVGKPQPGDTVVVSGAAGAVGTVVGQIARIKGCRAIGIAGGALAFFHSQTYNDGNAFIAPLPLLAYEWRAVTANLVYFPKVSSINEINTLGFWLTFWPKAF